MATSNSKRLKLILLCAVLLSAAVPAFAAYDPDARDEPRKAAVLPPEPVGMETLQEVRKSEAIVGKRKSDPNDKLSDAAIGEDDGEGLALKIRRDAQKESALSYGARGGLAWRTKEIMDELGQNEVALDKTYDFRRLLIKAPSNMYIEPPIVSEALNNFLVSPDGNEAAVSDTIYHISRQARIVSGPRNWRQYLERLWEKELATPPDILLPETPAERETWRRWVREGWLEGFKQADEIFQADLNRLVADFEGMVRYRVLLTQNKITAPYATMEDRGVSGTQTQAMVGNQQMDITTEMRVGDRAIRITQPSTFRPGHSEEAWDTPMQNAKVPLKGAPLEDVQAKHDRLAGTDPLFPPRRIETYDKPSDNWVTPEQVTQ